MKEVVLMNSIMWYRNPASEWKEGLPIGNGMLAGMVMGSVAQERVGLNHEWLWRANGRYRTTPPKHQHLKEIRDLFFQGKVLEAGELANERLGGSGGVLQHFSLELNILSTLFFCHREHPESTIHNNKD